MLVLVGTVPYKTGLYIGKADIQGSGLNVDGVSFSIARGTAAMAAACAQVCSFYSFEKPLCIFGGDVADGKGTDLMFREINANIDKYAPDILTLHYMFPKIIYGQPFIQKIESLTKKPQLIADAGGMYLMKTINQGHFFDVFTPDAGELHFLADEFAPHPLYVRSELLNENISLEVLVGAAYKNRNTAKVTIIKGAVDYIYSDNVKLRELSEPNIAAMEAIGGTGDTITGMVSAFRHMKDAEAEYKSLAINRLIGKEIKCNPATQIVDFITAIPKVLEKYAKKIS
jgi:NAD(P)H-hydrate repair Nnr-like enzyme with NAD(P)H-hydrate dehydratase domain